jgi:3-oxoacyl-[acyl-carrier-protein] reductase
MGKIAVVTGASKGIGRACALRLAKDGMTVVVNYSHSDAEAAKTVEEIKAAGGDAVAYKADVSDLNQVKDMFKFVSDTYGRVDILVNNAGIVRDEYLLMLTQENLDKCLDLNIKGYFYCAQQAALKMFSQKSGVIVNMSSVSSKMALAGQSVYSATKGAVNSMTQTMAKELARKKIRVNAVCPGFVQTEMVDQLPEDKKKEYLKEVPLGRFADVNEVAGLVSFLCSDDASYITGQAIVLDGGLSL